MIKGATKAQVRLLSNLKFSTAFICTHVWLQLLQQPHLVQLWSNFKRSNRYKCRHFNKYDDAISPCFFFFIPSGVKPVLATFTVCNFVVYFTFRLFGIAIAM